MVSPAPPQASPRPFRGVPGAVHRLVRHGPSPAPVGRVCIDEVRLHPIAAALLLGGALAAQAADRDASFQPGELLAGNAEYRQAWQDLVQDEERLPDWLINLSGLSTPMQAVEADSDRYLVGRGLYEEAQRCFNQRLYVAFEWRAMTPMRCMCRCRMACRKIAYPVSTPPCAGWATRMRKFGRCSWSSCETIELVSGRQFAGCPIVTAGTLSSPAVTASPPSSGASRHRLAAEGPCRQVLLANLGGSQCSTACG